MGGWIAMSILLFRFPPEGTHMEIILLNSEGQMLEPSTDLLSKLMNLGLLLLLWTSCFLFIQAYALRRSDERWLRICRSLVERLQANNAVTDGSVQGDPPNDGPATSVENSNASGGGRHR
jgi:hypothetical protein